MLPIAFLLIFSICPAPALSNSVAGALTVSRLVASGVADTPTCVNSAGR